METDTEEKKLLNRVIILFSLCTKTIIINYYCSFIKLRLNHWCHNNYFNNVFTTFLGLERFRSIAVYAGSENSDFIKNILICVPKMNEYLTGLEKQEGE